METSGQGEDCRCEVGVDGIRGDEADHNRLRGVVDEPGETFYVS